MRRTLYTVLLCGLLASCGGKTVTSKVAPTEPLSPLATDQEELIVSSAQPPQVYTGKMGVRAAIVYLEPTPEEKLRAIFRFTGVPHPLAGKALLLTGSQVNDDFFWALQFDGLSFSLLWQEASAVAQGSWLDVSLKVPRTLVRIPLTYDEAASRSFDPESLLALRSRHSQEQETLAATDKQFHVEAEELSLKSARAELERDCGARIAVELDWDSIFARRAHYQNACNSLIGAVTKVCRRDRASQGRVSRQVTTLRCSYDETNGVRLQDHTLTLTASTKESYNVSRLHGALVKELGLTRTVLEDSKGRILILNPDDYTSRSKVYLGDGQQMYRLRKHHASNNLWNGYGKVTLHHTGHDWSVRCFGRDLIFKGVPDERRLHILKTATFHEPKWQREAFALTRDNRGIYYYVDRRHKNFGGKNYRVFMGKRGQMRPTQLVDIVHDSDGMIFSTKGGNLRLVLSSPEFGQVSEGQWIERKKSRPLVVLPLNRNKELIYTGLGVYDGDDFGTICD